ncbi:mucosal pentraxin-like [Gracilinanus agilis]|uniref:mucosal pentraxin-like n=1 Tax=Gracilinanus agilis TaxID=191870 RepID=UPI001CFDBF44|nr:mucosal pentraxin-like [Gracilinanus agilis]
MENWFLWTLLLIIFSRTMAQTENSEEENEGQHFPAHSLYKDLHGKVFLFPRPSANSYMTLSPLMDTELQGFTVCLWVYTELTRGYSVFSYATKASPNEILLFRDRVGQYSLTIGTEEVTFKVQEPPLTPINICATWESASGVAEMWVDWKPLVRKVLKVGYTLSANAKIILGQDQDSYGGGFDINQSFVGEIGNVYMWDYVVPLQDIKTSYSKANVLNWKKMNYEEKGQVIKVSQLTI